MGKGSKYHCSYTFYDNNIGSGSHGKSSGACTGLVDSFNDVSNLTDDSGNSYKVSALYKSDSTGGSCNLFFTQTKCASENGFMSDSSHGVVQSYDVKCKVN